YSCLEYIIIDSDDEQDEEYIIPINDITAENGELPETDPYDTLHYLLSGGSTGVPKLIARTHSDYMYLCKLCCDRCELTSDDVYLVALPCEHNFPTGDPGFLGVMDVGGTAVFCSHISPDAVLDNITEYEVTITALVPTMVSMCIDMLEIDDDFDISSLRILQVGGSVFDDSAAERAIDTFRNATIMQVFGTSEGLIITTLINDSREIIKKYQGKALPDQFIDEKCETTIIRIVDSEDNDVADGEYGEVICKGPYIIDSYYGLGDADLSNFTEDGFYRTGDKAMRTPDGYYKFIGRIKEQINRAGEKIMPTELEEHLCMLERVQDAAVIGVPDPELGNKICAFMVSADGNEVTTEEVFDYLTEKGVARYKFPDKCITLDALPLTAVGKKDAKKLLAIAENEV
ncbi:MAG: AMP-binding protein, partial [Ruminococcus sp.]|nr:AMP-binding protein [Ruminococcus sp.]